MSDKLNLEIEKYLDSQPQDFTITEDVITFVSRYDKCDDYLLSRQLVESIWDLLGQGMVKTDKNVPSVLHTNSGAGKMFRFAPKNINITSYNMDYYCSRITDIVCDARKTDFYYRSHNIDIAQYFFQEIVGNNPKYDVVITQPKERDNDDENGGLNKLDSDLNFRSLPCYLYYAIRSCFFLNKGGILVILASSKQKDKIQSIFNSFYKDSSIAFDYKMSFVSELRTSDSNSYNALIFKNIGYGG
jgi:hypothetical protein